MRKRYATVRRDFICAFVGRIRYSRRDVILTAVDIDAAMLTVATNYFGLTCDDKLNVVIDDGLEFLEKSANAGEFIIVATISINSIILTEFIHVCPNILCAFLNIHSEPTTTKKTQDQGE